MLDALVPFTQRTRLRLMVFGTLTDSPSSSLKQAVNVGHVSGGSVDFGVGAGWPAWGREARGAPCPFARERADRFAWLRGFAPCRGGQERRTCEVVQRGSSWPSDAGAANRAGDGRRAPCRLSALLRPLPEALSPALHRRSRRRLDVEMAVDLRPQQRAQLAGGVDREQEAGPPAIGAWL